MTDEHPVPVGETEGSATVPDAEAPAVDILLEENARLKAQLDTKEQRMRARRMARRVLVGVLVILTSIMVVLAVVAWWSHATLLQTDRFLSTVGPLAQNPEVQTAVATYTTDSLFEALEVQTRIQDVLPDRLRPLAPPITRSVRDFTYDRMLDFTRTPAFEQLWTQSLTLGHEGMVRVIRDEAPNVSVVDGDVRLNFLPFMAEGLNRLTAAAGDLFNGDVNIDLTTLPGVQDPQVARQRIEQRLGVTLPPNFGTVRMMGADQLQTLQQSVRWFDRLVYLLAFLVLALIGAGLALSVNRRRTVVQLGAGIVLAVFIARIATRRVEAWILDSITDPTGRGAAGEGIRIMLGNLRSLATWILVIALIAAVVAYLLGQPRWLMTALAWGRRVTTRPADAPSEVEAFAATHYDWLRLGGGIVLALLLQWGLGFFSVLVVVVLGALWLGGVKVLRDRADAITGPADDGPALIAPPPPGPEDRIAAEVTAAPSTPELPPG